MEASTETNNKFGEEEQVVTPWEVAGNGGKIDYDKLIDRFGCQRIDQSLVQRVEKLTSQPAHVFLRRNVFFAHRYHFLSLYVYVTTPLIENRYLTCFSYIELCDFMKLLFVCAVCYVGFCAS